MLPWPCSRIQLSLASAGAHHTLQLTSQNPHFHNGIRPGSDEDPGGDSYEYTEQGHLLVSDPVGGSEDVARLWGTTPEATK
jgi:hypothetical protein